MTPLPPPSASFPVYPGHSDPYEVPPPQQQHAAAPVRPRTVNRSQSATVSRSRTTQLKSIMKKPAHERSASTGGAADVTPPPITRSRTNSTTRGRPRANSSTRPQADRLPPFIPDHIFVALHGTNEIRMENIAFQTTIEELREALLPMWPHGVTSEESRQHRWRAQYSGNPWTCSGPDSLISRRIICRFFSVLARQGYSYLTTLNTSHAPARLVFGGSEQAPSAHFFSVALSQSGDKISILDAPPMLAQDLATSLRNIFPWKVASDRATEDGVYVIELKKGIIGTQSDVDKSLFAAFILQYFDSAGYKLNGSLPIGKPRSFIGAQKELWIFRGSLRRSESMNGHRD
ncbi:hypothetical protein C8Q75DRAFT_231803 [Abortiporus biennis]|nr:hypothetical protein C8Q75DRAFT_231803 [Abortiporus biennis]